MAIATNLLPDRVRPGANSLNAHSRFPLSSRTRLVACSVLERSEQTPS